MDTLTRRFGSVLVLALTVLLAGLGGSASAAVAGLGDPPFWGSLAFALVVAGIVAFPVNRWLIARGRGHAVLHGHH